jgi:hypothetical protein
MNTIPKEIREYIKVATRETAIEIIEAYGRYGTLISRPDIISEIGKSLYDEGIRNGNLKPIRRTDTNRGKIWIKTSEYLRYKNEILNLN